MTSTFDRNSPVARVRRLRQMFFLQSLVLGVSAGGMLVAVMVKNSEELWSWILLAAVGTTLAAVFAAFYRKLKSLSTKILDGEK